MLAALTIVISVKLLFSIVLKYAAKTTIGKGIDCKIILNFYSIDMQPDKLQLQKN